MLLIISNPNLTAFKEYLRHSGYGGIKRERNFFVCSVYSFNGYFNNGNGKYLAIIGNFFLLEKLQPLKMKVKSCPSPLMGIGKPAEFSH